MPHELVSRWYALRERAASLNNQETSWGDLAAQACYREMERIETQLSVTPGDLSFGVDKFHIGTTVAVELGTACLDHLIPLALSAMADTSPAPTPLVA